MVRVLLQPPVTTPPIAAPTTSGTARVLSAGNGTPQSTGSPTGISGLQTQLQNQGQSYVGGLLPRIESEQLQGGQNVVKGITQGANLMQQGGQMANSSINKAQPSVNILGGIHPATSANLPGFDQGIKGGAKIAEGAGRSAFGAVAGTAQSALAPVTAIVSPVLSSKVGEFATGQFALPKATQDKINAQMQQLSQKHPDAAALASDMLNTVLLAAGGGEAEAPLKDASADMFSKQGVQDAKDSIKGVPQAASDVAGNAKSAIADHYIESEKKNWIEPTTKPIPAYNKATDIFNAAKSKGTDIAQTLIDNKIKLSENLGTNGAGKQVYDTADTAEKIRSDAQKVTSDLLRPSLREADLANPPIERKVFVDKAIQNIQKDRSLTGETKEKLIESIGAIKFEPTYTREGLLDEKITRDLNSKYSPVGDIATNQEAVKNKAIADAIRSTLSENVPKEIPIDDVNKEASKLYQTADYLDALNNKPVPRGFWSRFGSSTAKLGGFAVGETLGGGILGAVGGYHLGGVLERAFENMADPIKTAVLNSLEKSDPKVFGQLRSYLGDQEVARLTRKALPEGAALGSAANPIIAPAPLGSTATFEPRAQVVNTQQPPTQLALPPGQPGAIASPTVQLPPGGTGQAADLERSGMNEVQNAKMKNPADRRRVIKLGKGMGSPLGDGAVRQTAQVPKFTNLRDYEVGGRKFSEYNLGDSDGKMTIEKKPDGYTVANIEIPKEMQKQGIASSSYKSLNEESIRETGKPLQSSALGHLSQEGKKLWDSLVKSGNAKYIESEKIYRFK